MKPHTILVASFSVVFMVLGSMAFHIQPQAQMDRTAAATPTYDPLREPPLPPDPTELELGNNLYWHWCMPCHGDRAQGLTDEFRMIWEEDHQDCWARGCHGGLPRDEGFPIPRMVPSLVTEDHLARFEGLLQLADYLQATHPPQSPGILSTDQYHAIAAYVFSLNGRIIDSSVRPASYTESTPIPSQTAFPLPVILLVTLMPLAAVLIMALILSKQEGSRS